MPCPALDGLAKPDHRRESYRACLPDELALANAARFQARKCWRLKPSRRSVRVSRWLWQLRFVDSASTLLGFSGAAVYRAARTAGLMARATEFRVWPKRGSVDDDSAQLFGRGAEQERLRALLEDARNRRSGSLVLVGEPGAGKSALIDDVRTVASDMTVLEARGVESEAELPFASLHQLLLPTFDLLERLPAPQASALRAAFGLGDGDAPDLYRVPLAVLTLLAEAAEERPLLCLIDDAHWMDRDSEQALMLRGETAPGRRRGDPVCCSGRSVRACCAAAATRRAPVRHRGRGAAH